MGTVAEPTHALLHSLPTHLIALKAVCWEHLGPPAQVLCSRWEGAGSAEEVRFLKQQSTNEEKALMGKQTSFPPLL